MACALDQAAAPLVGSLQLDAEQQERYWSLDRQPQQAASYMSEALNLPEASHNARQAITVDYASYALELARKLQLSPAQTRTVLGVAGAALAATAAGSTPAEVQAGVSAQLIAACAAHPGPGSSDLTADHVAEVASFFASGLLQHHSLYRHAFCEDQQHEEHRAHLLVETSRVHPTLAAALPEAEWHTQLAAAAEARRAAAEAAAAAELERLQREREEAEAQAKATAAAARQEQLTKRPTTLSEAVEQLVAQRLEEERAALADHYRALEARLVGRLEALQVAPAAAGALGGGARK